MAKIVILGSGLTGISAAYHLEQKGFYDYRLFEKEDTIGGLCRSIQQDGFTFDFTGHLLHINDAYVQELIGSLIGFDQFNAITRRSFVYSHKRYTPYPFQINLNGLPSNVIAECIEGFIKRKTTIKNPATFHQWVMKNFGKGFGDHFFFNYQKKIFAYDIAKITASWTGRFVPATSLEQIIDGINGTSQQKAVGYNAQFFYPKEGGIISWVEQFAHYLINPIATKFCANKIDLVNKVVHFTNGHCEPFEQLITTMPLDLLLHNLQESSASTLKNVASKLKCNSVINFNLGIHDAILSTKHWIYYPELQYPFYRIGFPHNFSSTMVPAQCSSLYGEWAYFNKSKKYVHNYTQHAIVAAKKLLGISDNAIITEKIIPISHAYVIYDKWREHNLPKILNKLKENNVHSVGRYGAWKYSSMQEAILDGKQIADELVCTPASLTHFARQKEIYK